MLQSQGFFPVFRVFEGRFQEDLEQPHKDISVGQLFAHVLQYVKFVTDLPSDEFADRLHQDILVNFRGLSDVIQQLQSRDTEEKLIFENTNHHNKS